MQKISAKDAKYKFGELIDRARAGPVAITKHDRPVVVVIAVEEYERLSSGSSEPLTLTNAATIAKRSQKKGGA